jgi:hypothetical protein
MAKAPHTYKVKIIDIYLKVCKINVSPEVLLAHAAILEKTPAVYPYHSTTLKAYTVPQGQYTYTVDSPFQGTIPTKLYVFFVDAAACNGDFTKNPLEYKHYNITSAGFYVDGVSYPHQPLVTDFGHRDYVAAYHSLLGTADKLDHDFDITPKRFCDGCTILSFNLEMTVTNSLDYWVKPIEAHTRLELRFGTPTPHPVNVILMAVMPSLLYIDKARNVTTSFK